MDAMDNALVPMSESDVEASAALISRAMNTDEGRWAARTMAFHIGCRRHDLDDGRMYYVWKQDDAIRGLVGLHHIIWGPEENVWLAWFAVDPDCQGQGLGRSLLAAVEKTAIEKGYRKLLVETYAHEDFDKARRFYESNGFHEAGRVAGYLRDGSAMIVYARTLVEPNGRGASRDSGTTGELTDLSNIGRVLAEKLCRAGIKTASDLKAAGSVETLVRVRRTTAGDTPCASMLYALEGAIRGIRWHGILPGERAGLWQRYQTQAK